METKELKELEVELGEDLESVVNKLVELQKKGEMYYYAEFNGIKLYSKNVSLESAYKDVMGKSKQEWLMELEQERERLNKLLSKFEEEDRKKLPEWIEEGKKYIYEEKHSRWENECKSYFEVLHTGFAIENAVTIMKMLDEKKKFKDILEQMLKQGHTGMSKSTTLNIVLKYSKEGPKFYKYVNKRNINNIDAKYIEKIESLNKWLELGLKYDEVANSLKEYKTAQIDIYDDGRFLEGTLLIKNDMTFEGVFSTDEYFCGKFLEDNSIYLAKFSNEDLPFQYFFKKDEQEKVMTGKRVSYPTNENPSFKYVTLNFIPNYLDYREEIIEEARIYEFNKRINKNDRILIEVFKDRMDIEKDNLIKILKEQNKNMKKKYN